MAVYVLLLSLLAWCSAVAVLGWAGGARGGAAAARYPSGLAARGPHRGSSSHGSRRRHNAALCMDASGTVPSGERKTFKRFMQVELYRSPELESLYPILCGIETACRDINRLMRRVTTDNLDGLQGAVNVQGEEQKRLDVISNRIMKQSLCCTGKVSIVASEEEDEPCLCSTVTDTTFSGEFAAVFDPLDGSSNIDSGLPTGTIFGVHRNPAFGSSDPLKVVQQRGSNLVVAGYCIYSASCTICITLGGAASGSGVHMFTLDDVTGEFYLVRKNVRIPRSGGIYSFNEANAKSWPVGVVHFLDDFRAKRVQTKPAKTPTARYMGALVADAHNIILNGGIFGYPGTDKATGVLKSPYYLNRNTGAMMLHPATRRLDSLRRDYVKVLSLLGLRSAVAGDAEKTGQSLDDLMDE